MARSMTGFGSSEYELYNRTVSVELKSVNSKYLDIFIKLPKIISNYENDIKNIIKEEVQRGKIDVFINITYNTETDVSIKFDENLLDKYFEIFDKVCNRYNVEKPTIKDIMDIDGVIIKSDNYNDIDTLAEIWETLFVALNNAISDFVRLRDEEGDSLKSDILQKIDQLNIHLDEISSICDSINHDYESRLYRRIKTMLQNLEIDENDVKQRFITEICIFAEKSDIDEEIVRFSVNLDNLKNTLLKEAVIGKKLDFILQELNREVNTMASKSSDIRLSQNCISIKIILEKIREQAKNIE